MKRILSIVIGCLMVPAAMLAQENLTGVWRGSFYNIREVMLGGTKYRYEVQIDNRGQAVKGVTYSYQTTRFYGKSNMIGKWAPESNNLILMEDKMLDMRIEGGGEGCLMTCYLEYRKEGDIEYLEGTYTSKNMNNGTDCGGGRVRLERVTDSDFELEDFLKKPLREDKSSAGPQAKPAIKPGQEDFLVKKPAETKPQSATTKPKTTTPPPAAAKKTTPPPTASAKPKSATPQTKPPATPPSQSQAKTSTTPKTAATSTVKNTAPPKPKTPSASPVAKSGAKPPAPPDSLKTTASTAGSATKTTDTNNKAGETLVKPEPAKSPVVPKPAPPPAIKNRSNELFETIVTSARQITISFYDNGEIDGDTISVYDNNRLIVSHRGLSANPITLSVKLNDSDPEHDLVMVAENLGSIPPNTALMIVQAGARRFTLRLSSTEQKNAMVRFRYDPNSP